MLRRSDSLIAVSSVCALTLFVTSARAEAPPSFVQNGEAGFVVSDIAYALSEHADVTGACPNGYTLGGSHLGVTRRAAAELLTELGAPKDQIAAVGPLHGAGTDQPGQRERRRAAGEGDGEGADFYSGGANNTCASPTQYGPDPLWRSVEAPNIPVYGIDLDGQDSNIRGHAAPGTCPHNDFRGFNGERGIDNQFFRAVGCSLSFQPNGSTVPWAIEMLTGAYGIVIRLRGVDDIRNDPDVQVEIAANADPIQLSPGREPLANATYAMYQNPKYRAITHGRIVNGVLTTDPVNLRFRKVTNDVWFDRTLDEARLRVTISPDGTIEGIMAGYTDVEELFNFQFGMQHGDNNAGQPKVGAGTGAASVLGYSCNGAYFALKAAADGHRDPTTGHCSAISTQYKIRAIPAFIVDAATHSVNEKLTPGSTKTGN